MALLSIIIPAYNEERRLPNTLHAIAAYLRTSGRDAEVIVVDDGSQDQTVAAAEAMKTAFTDLRVLTLKRNSGKGAAVKEGVLSAKGEALLFTDADNSTPIEEIDKLFVHLEVYPVVIGSRHITDSNIVIQQPWYRVFVSRLGNLLVRLILTPGIHDTQCGFKLFTRTAAREIFSRQRISGSAFDMEILAIAKHILGYSIQEVPVSWHHSDDSRVRPMRDTFRTLQELFKMKRDFLLGRYNDQN